MHPNKIVPELVDIEDNEEYDIVITASYNEAEDKWCVIKITTISSETLFSTSVYELVVEFIKRLKLEPGLKYNILY